MAHIFCAKVIIPIVLFFSFVSNVYGSDIKNHLAEFDQVNVNTGINSVNESLSTGDLKFRNYKYQNRPVIALKTNILFDLAGALNIEAEYSISHNWSINSEFQFPWWVNSSKNNFAMQMLAGGIEGRYWLKSRSPKKRIFVGHFIGVYGGGGLYDFQFSEQKGYQGDFYSVGVLYGNSIPIIRNRLSVEFSIGLGYIYSNYILYKPVYDHTFLEFQENKKFQWIGPGKAKLSLVWILNRKVRTKH